ncbi:MAG TPA: hypothetical protein DCS43_00335 [Verrucomicrobia bacterium]|nr:hypothetical protein [Verrucomicrobiota bacterium]
MTRWLKRRAPLLCVAALLAATALLGERLATARGSAYTSSPNLPPSVALITVFLGGFRGLINDMLWIRAAVLQEQGRYFELVQLADWITALEPQHTSVWALQAWNMAYNVSILMPDKPGRWRWVQNGLHLLRDRGLPATGQDSSICLELGMLFQHKIGGIADESADYYKYMWARQIMQAACRDGRLETADSDVLSHEFKMDLATMQALETSYGPLDWRIPEAHAIYWAYVGRSRATDTKTTVLCQRMMYQCLATLVESGTMTTEPQGRFMVIATALPLLPGAIRAFEEALPDDPVANEGFANFLRRSIALLVFYHNPDEAQTLFTLLHQRYPTQDTAAGFDQFTRNRQMFMPKIITVE